MYQSLYKGVFTVGIKLIGRGAIVSANTIGNYSFVYARTGTGNKGMIARCVTGLGPNGSNSNSVLGGVYFNGSKILTGSSCDNSQVILSKPKSKFAGVFNIKQCGRFSTTAEGIYTCTIMNSSMMNESIRFGVYFTERSKSLDLYTSFYHLSSLYTAAPVIDTPSQSKVTVAVGFSFTLSCTSRGSPPDTFTWRKDNDTTVLQSTSITTVDYSSTSAVFSANYSIDNVTTSDSGTYTCNVTNPIGNSITNITVITGKIKIMIGDYRFIEPDTLIRYNPTTNVTHA